MEKISTSTRYADEYGKLKVTADVQKDEKNGEITAVNNGQVSDPDAGVSAWFNITQDGRLSLGNVDTADAEKVKDVTEAILEFYAKIKQEA